MRTLLKSLLLLPALLGTLGAFAASDIAAEVEYFYAKDGTIIGRAVNGVRSDYEYDAKGQLLAVKDAKTGEVREGYTYDPAGNILSKSVYGATTVYTYDASNQLVSATANGAKTTYAYDAAGRLIRAGSKSYRYGFKDKVLEVRDGAKTRARFSYYMDGQLKQANYADRTENFMWDGLALAKRDGVNFINEPHVTGGNPVLAGNSVMFNDMLGSTLSVDGKSIDMTAFGDSDDPAAMFTGKPQVEELGHVFLFRNYRAELGKWQTADPLGYPDGWNQLAYVNNGVISLFDKHGLCRWEGPNGIYRYVPLGEADPIANAPEGYNYVPCNYTVSLDSSSLSCYYYFSQPVSLPCNSEIHLYIPGYDNEGTIDEVFEYKCGDPDNAAISHGFQNCMVYCGVYLHPIVRAYDCLRKEIVDYARPDTSFPLEYVIRTEILSTRICE